MHKIFLPAAILLILVIFGYYVFMKCCGHSTVHGVSATRAMHYDMISALKMYYSHFEKYPSGDTKDILEELSGKNRDGVEFIRRSKFHRDCELWDPWGTPYRMNITGDNRFILRSAGKNRVFDAKDDEEWISNLNP